jgi:hypothetical protein
MNFSTLSAHAEEFLALKRAVAKVDPHRNAQDGRSLKHREKLRNSRGLTSNLCFVKSRKRKSISQQQASLLIFKERVRRRFITLSFGLGLPQSEHRTGGIPNETKPTHARDFGDVLHDFGA